MNIKLNVLKKSIVDAIDNLILIHGEEVRIESDYYWAIDKVERYDNYDEPKSFSVGQLSDDWQELEKVVQKENNAMPYSLVWASRFLELIGERGVEQEE